MNNIVTRTLTGLALTVSMCSATPSYAQNNSPACWKTNEVVEKLKERFKEQLIFYGVNVKGNVVSVYLNTETGTWTSVVTLPTGKTCLISAGNSGVFNEPLLGEEG